MCLMKIQSVGIQGHAVAEAPTGVARALLYIVEGSPSFFSLFIINHTSYSIIPFITKDKAKGVTFCPSRHL